MARIVAGTGTSHVPSVGVAYDRGKMLLPISVLDLAPVVQGATPGDALRCTLDLARHADQ